MEILESEATDYRTSIQPLMVQRHLQGKNNLIHLNPLLIRTMQI